VSLLLVRLKMKLLLVPRVVRRQATIRQLTLKYTNKTIQFQCGNDVYQVQT